MWSKSTGAYDLIYGHNFKKILFLVDDVAYAQVSSSVNSVHYHVNKLAYLSALILIYIYDQC